MAPSIGLRVASTASSAISVTLSDEMRNRASLEADRRSQHIRHHFDVDHYTGHDRDVLGFLGEFAARELLGLRWDSGIRDTYELPDAGDIAIGACVIDVKTESIPADRMQAALRNTVGQAGTYTSRWVNVGQTQLLDAYDIVLFGLFARLAVSELKQWHAIGWIEADRVGDFPVVGSGARAAHAIPNASLRRLSELDDAIETWRAHPMLET